MATKFLHVRGACVGAYQTHPKSAPERTNNWIYVTNGLHTQQVRVFDGIPVPAVGAEGLFTVQVTYPDNPPFFSDNFKYSLQGYSPVPEV